MRLNNRPYHTTLSQLTTCLALTFYYTLVLTYTLAGDREYRRHRLALPRGHGEHERVPPHPRGARLAAAPRAAGALSESIRYSTGRREVPPACLLACLLTHLFATYLRTAACRVDICREQGDRCAEHRWPATLAPAGNPDAILMNVLVCPS